MRKTRLTSAAVIVAATSLAVGSVVSAQSPGASGAPAGSSDLKIGLVTDVGTIDDKGFNEYSFAGTVDGAAAIGAAAPLSVGALAIGGSAALSGI